MSSLQLCLEDWQCRNVVLALKRVDAVGVSSLYIVSSFSYPPPFLSIRITIILQWLLLSVKLSLPVPVLLTLSMRQLVECSQQSLGVTMLVLQKRRGREERLSNTTKKWQDWDVNRSYASPSTHSPSLHIYWASARCLVLCRTPADEQSIFSDLWHSRRKTQQQATEGRQVLKNSALESGGNRDTQTNRQKVFRIQYVVAKICHLVHFSQASKEAAALSSFLGTSLKLCCWFCNQMGQSLLSAQFLRVQKSFLKA